MADLIKVYSYTRVSTTMQVDGYSLDAQKEKIERLAMMSGYKIVGYYSDEGKSGKSIEGRPEFVQMLKDIEEEKDGVKYVIVFKLSRFGRNTLDILKSLEVMKLHDVHLISVEDNLYSDSPAGKIMIQILSSIAEIERENILVQTMAGRMEKARQGKWNGGFAPYGYKLENGSLIINEEEAEAIRIIFDKYANTDMGSVAITKYLVRNEIKKNPRQNGKNEFFSETMVRKVLENPVYAGKIAFGRRKTEKIKGTEKTHIVKQDEYGVYEGQHEAIISEELWEAVQKKRLEQAGKYEHDYKNEHVHILTGLIKCPICGKGLYGNKSIKNRNGKHYKDYFFYGCKHRQAVDGHKCTFSKQIAEDKFDSAVAEIVIKLVQNPKFANLIKEKINTTIDISTITAEYENLIQQYKKVVALKDRLNEMKLKIDPFDKHYELKVTDIDKQVEAQYDKMVDLQDAIEECGSRKKNIEEAHLSSQRIYKILVYFDKLYDTMDDKDKQLFFKSLIKEIQIYEEPVGKQWIKSIKFTFPILDGVDEIGLDNESTVETVVLLTRKNGGGYQVEIDIPIHCDESGELAKEEKATYSNIKKYIYDKFGVNVHTNHIAQIKRACGMDMRECYHKSKKENPWIDVCTPEKAEYIKEALRYYNVI